MSEPVSSTAPAPVNDRVVFALRQATLLGAALVVGGLVTERLRPDELLDRGFAATVFLWAIAVWLIVLLFNAIAFERSQMSDLETIPLFGGLVVGAFLFLSGLIGLDGGSIGRRLMYVFAHSLGAVLFWWAVFSLGFLIVQRLRSIRP